jgi:hypothetical protein
VMKAVYGSLSQVEKRRSLCRKRRAVGRIDKDDPRWSYRVNDSGQDLVQIVPIGPISDDHEVAIEEPLGYPRDA